MRLNMDMPLAGFGLNAREVRVRKLSVRWVCIRHEVHAWVGAGKKVKIVGLTR